MNANQRNLSLILAVLFLTQSAGISFAADKAASDSAAALVVSLKDADKKSSDVKDAGQEDDSLSFLEGAAISIQGKKEKDKGKGGQDEHKIQVGQPVAGDLTTNSVKISITVEDDNGQSISAEQSVFLKYGIKGTDPNKFKSVKMTKKGALLFEKEISKLLPGTEYTVFVVVLSADKKILKTSASTDFTTLV